MLIIIPAAIVSIMIIVLMVNYHEPIENSQAFLDAMNQDENSYS